jgi:hypothetical protein
VTIKRKTSLRRSTRPIPRKTRVKPVNRRRKAREFQRAYGGAERAAFVAAMACIVGRIQGVSDCEGPIENVHVKGGGAGRKADARFNVPGCRGHHRKLHAWGVRRFEEHYGVDLDAEAAAVEEAWQTFSKGSELEQRQAKG